MAGADERAPKSGRTRRDVVRSAVYVAPFILTLAAAPAFASKGTGGKGKGKGKGKKGGGWDSGWD